MVVEDTGSGTNSESEAEAELFAKSLKIPSRTLMNSSALLLRRNINTRQMTAVYLSEDTKMTRRLIAHHMQRRGQL